MELNLDLILAIVAAVIAAIILIQSRGSAFLGWAVLCLAVIHLIPALG